MKTESRQILKAARERLASDVFAYFDNPTLCRKGLVLRYRHGFLSAGPDSMARRVSAWVASTSCLLLYYLY